MLKSATPILSPALDSPLFPLSLDNEVAENVPRELDGKLSQENSQSYLQGPTKRKEALKLQSKQITSLAANKTEDNKGRHKNETHIRAY